MRAVREEAGGVEEKHARLCLAEARRRSSADTAVGAPVSPVLAEDEKICRICFEGAELPSHPLVQPCACRGSSTWVHADCLTKWRRTSLKADAAYLCGQCEDHYRDALTLELLRERLRQQRAVHHPETHSTMHELGNQLHAQGNFDQAKPLFREALQANRETLGNRHPSRSPRSTTSGC